MIGDDVRKAGDDAADAAHVGQKADEFMALRGERNGALRHVGVAREQFRIMFRQHAAAGAGRRDDVVATGECIDILRGDRLRSGAVAGIVRRLPATRLRGDDHLAAAVLDQPHGGEADARAKQIDETGDEQADAGFAGGCFGS